MAIQANGNYHHFFIRIPILYFATFWSILSKKNHVLVVAVELIWFLFLNILSFNFVQTPNQSLRFRRCRRNYVHHSVFVPTNHCQIFTACFCLMCAVQSGHIPATCSNVVINSKVGKHTQRCEIAIHKYMITNS